MTLHLPTFFDYARRAPFGGRLTTEQVKGAEAIMAAASGVTDDRHLAYMLATAFHETAGTMAPVREGSTAARRLTDAQARRVVAKRRYGREIGGHVYYGRGLVQLTWRRNYLKMGEALALPLAEEPDRLLDLEVSARVLVEGMTNGATDVGDFTGKSVSDYFNDTTDDPEGARRIVNGTDKASLIAGYHRAFLDSIKAARAEAVRLARVPEPVPALVPSIADRPPLAKDQTALGGVLAGLGGLGGIAAAAGPILQGVTNVWALLALVVVLVGVSLVLTGRLKLRFQGGV